MPKRDRDQALEAVGRPLYGHHWIGELGKREWELGPKYRADVWGAPRRSFELPSPAKGAAATAQALFRAHAADFQVEQVLRWMREPGIDCTPDGFASGTFERWICRKLSAR
jgi:hypothetical protein